MEEEERYALALAGVPGLGPSHIRHLITVLGSPKAVLTAPAARLLRQEGMGKVRTAALLHPGHLERAEREMEQCRKHGIRFCHMFGPGYPKRLLRCPDAPFLLYYKGEKIPQCDQMLAVVGTRRATAYGREMTATILRPFEGSDTAIVSGLARGIDGAAHAAALALGLPTIGVMAHGLDMIYPPSHRRLAVAMLERGGCLLSEYPCGTLPERYHFPARNRIIAGMCDAALVVESAEKGGALITAHIAASYDREVFAVPGRPVDGQSRGCNFLIRDHVAVPVESGTHIQQWMDWGDGPSRRISGRDLSALGVDERVVMEVLSNGNTALHIDDLVRACPMDAHRLNAVLLTLELGGWLTVRPGNRYEVA